MKRIGLIAIITAVLATVGFFAYGRKPVINTERFAEDDKIREGIMRAFAPSGDSAQPDKGPTRVALLTALRSIKIEGVNVLDQHGQCNEAGCFNNVEYKDEDTFKTYVEATHKAYRDDSSPFGKYPFGSGRTKLLKRGDKWIATWFFLAPHKNWGGDPDKAKKQPKEEKAQ
jgi:hypothetical protein